MMEKHHVMGLGGSCCPAVVLRALGVQLKGGDRAKTKLTEPNKSEQSQWRSDHHCLAARGACGELTGRPSAGMLAMERGSTSLHLLPAHSLAPEATQMRSFSLDEDRDSCFGEQRAASCEVQLPFSRHWIFPSLEDQCKMDPGSRAAGRSAHSTHSSTFLHSFSLVGPVEIFARILRKPQEFCFPGFAKAFLLIKQPREM